jgi:hypothetical protein
VPTTQPNPANPAPDRQRQAEAVALALLLAGRKRFDLPALVKAKGLKPRPMRRIAVTNALEADLAAPFFSIVRAWQAEQPGLVAAYQSATADSDIAALHRALDNAGARVDQVAGFVRRQIRPAIQRIEQWHRLTWASWIKVATGIDITMFTALGDVASEVANAVAWNEALADDVAAQTKGRIVSRAIAAATSGKPATKADARTAGVEPETSVEALISDAVAKAKRRAAGIASDQAEKTSAAFTRGRAASAGLGLWRWKHYDPQPHPRIEHIQRDGTVYSGVRPPPTMPGEEPYCKCWQEWLFTAPPAL